jgi:hypothetical protein
LVLKTAGSYTLSFSDGAFTSVSVPVTVGAAAADHMVIGQQPTKSVAGQAISPAITVRLFDPYGNLATTSKITVALGIAGGPAGATLSGTTTAAAVNGVATFSAAILTQAGTYKLKATATGLAALTSNSFTVSAGKLSQFSVSGFPTQTTAGVAHNFMVTAQDAYGNTITSYRGTVQISSSDPQVPTTTYTFRPGDQGEHTFSSALKTAGTQSLTVSDSSNLNITGSQTSIQVRPAKAARLALSVAGRVASGAPFSVTVTAYDAYGNVATGYVGTVRLSSSDHSATLPGAYTFKSSDAGIHVFTGLVLRAKGKQTLTIMDALVPTLDTTASIQVT